MEEKNKIRLLRSGFATACRLACETLSQGRSAVLLTLEQKDFLLARSLLHLFLEGSTSKDQTQTTWLAPCQYFPSFAGKRSRDFWSQTLANLYALGQSGGHCLLVRPEHLLLRYMPLQFFHNHTLDLQCAEEYSTELIQEQLIDWGYTRVQMVVQPGDFAARGDILDIFPPGYARPVRLEFFGENIEEIRLFSPDSQRSLHNLKQVTLLPVQPILLTETERVATLTRCDRLYKAGRLTENELYSIKQAIENKRHGLLPGVIYEEASLLEQWLAPETLWLLPDEKDSVEALQVTGAELKNFLEDENTLLPQPANLALRKTSQPASWNKFDCVTLEKQVLGVQTQGLDRQEKTIHSFEELFPQPEAKDRPWQYLITGLKKWTQEYNQIILSFASEKSRSGFVRLAEQDGLYLRPRYELNAKGVFVLISPFRSGVDLVWDKMLILGEDLIYPKAAKRPRAMPGNFKGLNSFEQLQVGDLIVHRDYGIGRFAGLHHLKVGHFANDFLLLEYADNDKLYVPVDKLALIQRFKSTDGQEQSVDKLGGSAWNIGREKARKAIEQIAADLVEMYAYRKVAKGFSYAPVGDLYHEFALTFGFEETPDQAKAIQDVLHDMEASRPMDRLICGDVGFGKTEVALRAAFRAATENRQTVLLCPTTVLAEQHYRTFRARLAGFPVNVGLLSRFVSRTKQKEVLATAAKGQIDILIGTHRLLSADVHLPNLALLILDEEHRFGVRHKEKLKDLKKNVDVLTLTATPIPRTLQLSMSGIRDLSRIETAPQDRKPVQTAILQRDDTVLRNILERELHRKGQVFWVYNRVHGLERVADYVRKLVPEAKIGLAHGQMSESLLEETMHKFWHGELNVLVCTSIIESGLDFPNANTLIVDQAQLFGLGQLYQLRGRVGRSEQQAYAFFLVPDVTHLPKVTEERLRIIAEMDYLGAGFQLALEDLRLRGAGNILGEAQSGHMNRVGLDLYLEMLEQAVAKMKGTPVQTETETEISLGLPAHLPESYIPDGRERLGFYKALTSAKNSREREEIALEMRDRFGTFPQEVENFLTILDLKQQLGSFCVHKADIHPDHLTLSWMSEKVVPEKIITVLPNLHGVQIRPPATLILPLQNDKSFSVTLQELVHKLNGG